MPHDMGALQPAGGLLDWLAGNGYMLHRGCFLYDNGWVIAYVAANWLISLAYALVALLIAQRMYRASHIQKTIMGFSLLGIFVTCSFGHLLAGVTTVLWPGYRFETFAHWLTVIPAWVFLAHHKRFSLIVEGPHMIAESREELARKNGELNTLYIQLKQMDELKSQFFANVSHELRTPLALVLGPTEKLLRGEGLTASQREDLTLIQRNARTLLKHVNDLLDVAKMEAGKMNVRYAETDLAALTRLMTAHFDGVARERSLTLEVACPDTLPAQLDPDKIQRVLLNLLSNAVKFTPNGGHIRVKLEAEEGFATLRVQDNGPGISPEMREIVFERFRQVDSASTRQFGGTGLGLAIVKDFVELHGGSVEVSEAPGGGSIFSIVLPLNAPAGVEVQPAPTGSDEDRMQQALDELRVHQQSETVLHHTDEPLVLIVEDNVDMRGFLLDTLGETYRTATAHDGIEGEQKALELEPDLILSDVMMPRRTGDQMVRELRKNPKFDETPIVLLTAKADDELRIQMLRSGAQDYVMKPVAVEELRARVGNLVTMKRARQALQLELAVKTENLETLAVEVVNRKRQIQTALEETRDRNEQLALAVQEAHHRIKNNLQSVTALLEMQIDPAETQIPVQTVYQSLLRIKTIALVHDMLSRDRPIGDVAVDTVLRRLTELLSNGLRTPQNGAPIRLEAEPVSLPTKVATSLALIVNELVSNAAKHSAVFRDSQETGGENAIVVSLHREPGRLRLVVEDPGPGFPADFNAVQDAHFGLDLVASLVSADLQGEITYGNAPDSGFPRGRVTISFPERPASA